MRNILFSFIFFLTLLSIAKAQDISTDRPDQTESPSIVPVKKLQVETGFFYDKENETKTLFIPATLFRFGIATNFELRCVAEVLYEKELKSGEHSTGLSPVEIGCKTNIIKSKKWVPEISLITHFILPNAASENFKTDYPAPSFVLAMQNSLSEKLSLGYNLGAEWDGENAAPGYIYTASLGFDIGKNAGGFFEIFGDFAPQSKATHRADAGITWLVKRNLQLDLSGGIQISKSDALNYFFGSGISWRIPD